jgi:type IV secretory pathway ATPase VirB11/archaellum biosynthesis ATPase
MTQRPVHRVAGPYRVTFSPEAWRLIGSMPSSTFQSLQRALERIADVPRRTGSEAEPVLSATLDDLTIVYKLNDAERVLTVVNLFRANS